MEGLVVESIFTPELGLDAPVPPVPVKVIVAPDATTEEVSSRKIPKLLPVPEPPVPVSVMPEELAVRVLVPSRWIPTQLSPVLSPCPVPLQVKLPEAVIGELLT